MLSVKAIYDGEKIKFLQKVSIKSPKEVIVTFLDEDDDITSEELVAIAQQGGAFEFLKDEEDIYTARDVKARYRVAKPKKK